MSKKEITLNNRQAIESADQDWNKNHPGTAHPLTLAERREWISSYRKHDAESRGQRSEPNVVARSSTKVGSPTASCAKKEPIRCALKSIEVGPCSHKSSLILGKPRKYKFKTLSDSDQDEKNGDHHKAKGNYHNEYHIIAGDEEEPDKVKIKVEIEKPLCHEHKPILVDVDTGELHKLIPNSTTEIVAYSKELPGVLDDPIQFLHNCWWLERIPPRVYQISTNACAGNSPLVATIKAFPDLKWKIEASIGLGTSGASAETEKDEIVVKGIDNRGWQLQGCQWVRRSNTNIMERNGT